MQRVKLTFVGVVALVGVLALSGCQASPTLAASIGGVSIQNADVDATVATIEDDFAKANKQLPPELHGDVRQRVMLATVFNEVARRYAKEKNIPVPAVDYNAAAQQFGLPASDPYVRLNADTQVLLSTLLAAAKPATPTEADYHEAYDLYRAAAGEQASSYEEVQPEIAALTEFNTALGLRQELVAAADRYGLVVNPRYSPLRAPVLQVQTSGGDALTLLTMPLGNQGTGAVRDL